MSWHEDPLFYCLRRGIKRTLFSSLLGAGLFTGASTPRPESIVLSDQVTFTSSNLPILVIDTGGKPIVDPVRITAHLGIIDNGPGRRNALTDLYNGYDGPIAIELRGSATAAYPKKQYRFETQDASGQNRNVSLLGLPKENDWILYGPYVDDPTALRNVIAYGLSRDMGRYASRTRFCELVINGDYRGLYVLMEKIKRDKNRVAIAPMDSDDVAGDSLTGGYILKIDKGAGENVGGWVSRHRIRYQYHEPKASEIRPEQAAYIRDFMDRFESAMAGEDLANPETGYPALIDVDAAVDHFLLSEVAKNVDAYRISSYMAKDRDSRGGKLVFGPIWDFNLTFGQSWFPQDRDVTDAWQVDYNTTHPGDVFQVPFFWIRLSRDPAFIRRAVERYATLRRALLDEENLFKRIDRLAAEIEEARIRDAVRWPKTGPSYEAEIQRMKDWIRARLAFMDENLVRLAPAASEGLSAFLLKASYPNPFHEETRIPLVLFVPAWVSIHLFDIRGRMIRTLWEGPCQTGHFEVVWDGRDEGGREVPQGVYVLGVTMGKERVGMRVVKVGR